MVHEEELWLSESYYDYGARCCPPQMGFRGRQGIRLIWTDLCNGGLKGRYAFNLKKMKVRLKMEILVQAFVRVMSARRKEKK